MRQGIPRGQQAKLVAASFGETHRAHTHTAHESSFDIRETTGNISRVRVAAAMKNSREIPGEIDAGPGKYTRAVCFTIERMGKGGGGGEERSLIRGRPS